MCDLNKYFMQYPNIEYSLRQRCTANQKMKWDAYPFGAHPQYHSSSIRQVKPQLINEVYPQRIKRGHIPNYNVFKITNLCQLRHATNSLFSFSIQYMTRSIFDAAATAAFDVPLFFARRL